MVAERDAVTTIRPELSVTPEVLDKLIAFGDGEATTKSICTSLTGARDESLIVKANGTLTESVGTTALAGVKLDLLISACCGTISIVTTMEISLPSMPVVEPRPVRFAQKLMCLTPRTVVSTK